MKQPRAKTTIFTAHISTKNCLQVKPSFLAVVSGPAFRMRFHTTSVGSQRSQVVASLEIQIAGLESDAAFFESPSGHVHAIGWQGWNATRWPPLEAIEWQHSCEYSGMERPSKNRILHGCPRQAPYQISFYDLWSSCVNFFWPSLNKRPEIQIRNGFCVRKHPLNHPQLF